MSRSNKWTLSLLAAAVMLVGWSLTAAVAQQPAAKGKIKVTVKAADGTAAAQMPVSLFKGDYTPPRGGRGRGGDGGGGGAPGGAAGGAPPATQPTLATGVTDAQGVFTFEDVDAGQMTVYAGNLGGGGRGRGQGGGGGGAPGAGAAPPPGGGAPGGGPGGGFGRGRGFGRAVVTVKAGETVDAPIELQAGGRGGGRRGGDGGGAPGGAPGAPGQGA